MYIRIELFTSICIFQEDDPVKVLKAEITNEELGDWKISLRVWFPELKASQKVKFELQNPSNTLKYLVKGLHKRFVSSAFKVIFPKSNWPRD